MRGFVYIIQDSLSRKFYIGSTNDLERRLKQHRYGHTATTKRMKKKKLVFSQEFETLELARKTELRIKNFKRKDYIEKIIEDGLIKANY